MKTIKKLGIILQNLYCGNCRGSSSFGINGIVLAIGFFLMKIGSILKIKN